MAGNILSTKGSRRAGARARLGVWAVVAAALTCGCASYEAAQLPTRDARMMINRFESPDGFILSGAMLAKTEDCQLYFDDDLLSRDILPVAVYMANTSKKEQSFEVRLEGVQLRLADQTEFDQVPISEVLEQVEHSGWRSAPFWLLLIVPGAIVLNSVNNANEAMLQDYRGKALEDVNVFPQADKTVNRVAFFRPKDKALEECDLSKAILSADVNMRGQDSDGRPFKASIGLNR